MKHHLCSTLILTLPDLQNSFETKIDASNYAFSTVVTHHRHMMAYHSEALSDAVYKYPTYDKEMYFIVQAY